MQSDEPQYLECCIRWIWCYAFKEFAPKDGSFNVTGWAIMAAHIIQMVLLLDFIYYYVKNWMCARCIEAMKKAGNNHPSTQTEIMSEL